jgi:hypothetical protein
MKEEAKTTSEDAIDASAQAPLRAARLNITETTTAESTKKVVLGRTKRCLYLAASSSVGDLRVGLESAEEDVDCN